MLLLAGQLGAQLSQKVKLRNGQNSSLFLAHNFCHSPRSANTKVVENKNQNPL